jgi:hypothetical protein
VALGLYALAAAFGELRAPGFWTAMIRDVETTPALRFLIGFAVLFFGTAIFLVGLWGGGDWLAVLIAVIGALAVLEGVVILAFGEAYLAFGRALIGTGSRARAWALVSLLFGLAAIAVGLAHLT